MSRPRKTSSNLSTQTFCLSYQYRAYPTDFQQYGMENWFLGCTVFIMVRQRSIDSYRDTGKGLNLLRSAELPAKESEGRPRALHNPQSGVPGLPAESKKTTTSSSSMFGARGPVRAGPCASPDFFCRGDPIDSPYFSFIIFIIAFMKAGRSEGCRDVTRFPSITTSLSSYRAPASFISCATDL
jgi:hypothetical protein